MDIKERIDALTEAEAKAALAWCLEVLVIYQTAAWTKEPPDVDGLQKILLRQALKEVRK